MKKGIFKLTIKATAIFFLLSNMLFAQTKVNNEDYEELLTNWKVMMKELHTKLSISNADFKLFVSFYKEKNDSLKIEFRRRIKDGRITSTDVGSYMASIELQEMNMYKKFLQVKKDYPTSVNEYSFKNRNLKPQATCNPGCTNVDFSNGTLSGWNAYYAENTSSSTSYIFTNQTGGAVGSVTGAANDPFTNLTGGNDYQVEIMTGGYDPLAKSVPTVYPFGGTKYSVRLGDSTNPNQGMAILSQSFMVTAANATLTYEYAVFLENPSGHTYYEQPFFQVEVLDSVGDTISHCTTYNVNSTNAAANGYDSVYYATDLDYVYYKNWQVVFTDLKKYIGQCVTLKFQSADCSLGGHFGYAYVSATCTPVSIITSSPAICGQNHITLTAPIGAAQYIWSGPTNGIVSATDTTQSINVDSAGTYSVILVPFYGKSCADTLSITIKRAPGPPPIPNFTADTVCLGALTNFTNTSAPSAGAGVSFYWSFYNNGVINDSTANPNWSFTQPGVYNVMLDEVNNGCGSDTIIKVKVDSIPTASFKASNDCVGQNVTFTNNSTGATSYTWYFDNGTTSNAVSPTATYTVAGTYTVSLVAENAGKCKDSISKVIKINAVPVISITSSIKKDTICPGTSIKLTAAGANNYNWQPGNHNGKTITVTPTVTTTYTVSGSNSNGCDGYDSVMVVVLPVPTLVITGNPSDTICSGTSTVLTVSGATTYTWGPSTGLVPTTGAIVTASPTTTVTYTVTSGLSASGCSAKDSVTVTVLGGNSSPPKVTLSRDSLCPGTSIAVTASGASTFDWHNGSGFTSTNSIIVSPIGLPDTTITVTLHSMCRADTTISVVIFIEPKPNPVITGGDSICPGTSEILTVNSTVGTPGYLWLTTTNRTDTLTVAPKTQTTYSVVAANGGCTTTATFTVSIRPLPVVKASASPDTICSGSSVTLSGLGTATSYSWSPVTTPAAGATVTATPTMTTIYTVTGTDICSATAKVKVTVISTTITPTPITLSRDSLCPGTLITLSTPYIAGDNYSWSPSGGTVTPPGNSYIVGPTTPGNNTYTLTLSNKCADTAYTALVFVESVPTPSIKASSNQICAGQSTVLTASSGSGSPGYLWLNGATGTNINSNVITVSPTTQTVYTVEAADGGCVVSATDTVSISATPTVSITGIDSACKGDSIMLTATGGGTYLWFTGQKTSTVYFVVNSPANAWVKVTGSDGCQATDTARITLKTPPAIWAYYDTTINLGGVATIGVTGGASWVWEPSATVANMNAQITTATPTVNTVYTVVVTGANGCKNKDSVIVDIACEQLMVPNVFTPDLAVGTQYINDNIFYIKGALSMPTYQIEIYNRWGAPVYTSSDPSKSWDGKDKAGAELSSGVYYYIIKANCGEKDYSTKGFVQIIRNK